MELKDLNELDFAAWKNPWADLDDEAPDRDPERDGVLTLQRLLETVADHPRPVRGGHRDQAPDPLRGAGGAAAGGDAAGVRLGTEPDSPARVMSFSYVALQRVQRLAPDLRLVMLVEKARHWPVLKPFVDDGLDRRPGHRHAAAGTRPSPGGWPTAAARSTSGPSTPRPTCETCLDLGVRAVITDRPRFMMGLLDDRFG